MNDQLERALTALTDADIEHSTADLDTHSRDAWPVATVLDRMNQHPYRPDVVAFASTVDEVSTVIGIARMFKLPITPWGLGSSVTGQPLPTRGGIVLDMSRMLTEPVLNETDRTVTVGAGHCGGDLEIWLNERGYTLNNSPQSLHRSTVGGWVSTRETGQYSSRYGGIEALTVGYRAVLPDGTVTQFDQRPRAAMGPDLRHLLIGAEGALGIVTDVTMRIFAAAESRILEAFAVPDVESGIAIMRDLTQLGLRPFIVRFYDTDEARHAVPDSDVDSPVLFLGSEGPERLAAVEHEFAAKIASGYGAESIGSTPVEAWMARRYDFSTVENLLAETGGYAETIEVANMWSRIGPMYTDLKAELAPLADEVLGHFSHVYDQGSSLYLILLGRETDDKSALERLRNIWTTAMKVVIDHEGELSHHHGGGLARQEWVRTRLGQSHATLAAIKRALDPDMLFNPGKLGF